MIKTRWSTCEDVQSLAHVHADAWRFAYCGLIPGLTLERMIAAHDADWWMAMHAAGAKSLVLEFDGSVRGYARIGQCRNREFERAGEIHELYLDPACHGAGFGRRLFGEARRRLAARGHTGVVVWSLAVNEVGCRFYRALGGRIRAKGATRVGGIDFDRIAFSWT